MRDERQDPTSTRISARLLVALTPWMWAREGGGGHAHGARVAEVVLEATTLIVLHELLVRPRPLCAPTVGHAPPLAGALAAVLSWAHTYAWRDALKFRGQIMILICVFEAENNHDEIQFYLDFGSDTP